MSVRWSLPELAKLASELAVIRTLHTETGDHEGRVRRLVGDASYDVTQVGGLAGVIQTACAIERATAAAKDEHGGAPASRGRFREARTHVVRRGRAFETVKDDQMRCAGRTV